MEVRSIAVALCGGRRRVGVVGQYDAECDGEGPRLRCAGRPTADASSMSGCTALGDCPSRMSVEAPQGRRCAQCAVVPRSGGCPTHHMEDADREGRVGGGGRALDVMYLRDDRDVPVQSLSCTYLVVVECRAIGDDRCAMPHERSTIGIKRCATSVSRYSVCEEYCAMSAARRARRWCAPSGRRYAETSRPAPSGVVRTASGAFGVHERMDRRHVGCGCAVDSIKSAASTSK